MFDKENIGPLDSMGNLTTHCVGKQNNKRIVVPENNSLYEMLGNVEKILIKHDGSGRFSAVDEEWRSLLAILMKSGELILQMDNQILESKSELLKTEHHRISSLTKATGILGRLDLSKTTDSIACYPRSMVFEDNKEVSNNEPVLSRVSLEVDSAYYRYKEALIDLDLKSDCVLAFLEKQIDASLRLDRFNCDETVLHPVSSSTEFSLISTAEELNNLDKTKTRHWLNDVLKWQEIDLDLHARSLTNTAQFKKEIREKGNKIKMILRQKVQAAIHLKMLQLANKSLDSIVNCVTTDSNKPVSHQMVQAPSLFPVDNGVNVET